MRLMMLNALVLPAPFGPMRPQILWGATSKESLSKAWIPPNDSERSVMARAGAFMACPEIPVGSGCRRGDVYTGRLPRFGGRVVREHRTVPDGEWNVTVDDRSGVGEVQWQYRVSGPDC